MEYNIKEEIPILNQILFIIENIDNNIDNVSNEDISKTIELVNKLKFIQNNLLEIKNNAALMKNIKFANVFIQTLLNQNLKSLRVSSDLTQSDINGVFPIDSVSENNINEIIINDDISMKIECESNHFFVLMHSNKDGIDIKLDPIEIGIQNNSNCGIHANELMFIANKLVNFLLKNNIEPKLDIINYLIVDTFLDYQSYSNEYTAAYEKMRKLIFCLEALDAIKYFFSNLIDQYVGNIPSNLLDEMFQVVTKSNELSDNLKNKLIKYSGPISYLEKNFDESKAVKKIKQRNQNYQQNKRIIDNLLSFLTINNETLNNKLYDLVADGEIGDEEIINSIVNVIKEECKEDKIDEDTIKSCLSFYINEEEIESELNVNEEEQEQELNDSNNLKSLKDFDTNLENADELSQYYDLVENILKISEEGSENTNKPIIIEKVTNLLLNSSFLLNSPVFARHANSFFNDLYDKKNDFNTKLNCLLDILFKDIDYLENKNSLDSVLEAENILEKSTNSPIAKMARI